MSGKKIRKLVSFDWAMKRLLRSKANFDVLEGFLSELLRQDITILEVLGDETGRDSADDKYARIDILVKDSQERQIIIEVQYESEADYFQRIAFGAARNICDNLDEGSPYSHIKQVISISIVYFDLGQGRDYVYVGNTRFVGMHFHDELELSQAQKTLFNRPCVADLFPTFYLLKINQFNDVSKDGIDEWIYFLKHEEIRGTAHAKGLEAAKSKLDIMKLPAAERQAYERYIEDRRSQISIIEHSVKRAERVEQELEEALHREEGERRQKEEALQREEAALAKLEAALAGLMEGGMSEEAARIMLGIQKPR